MAQESPIEWTNATWNPVTGCTKISSGCKNCYAERMAKRLKVMRQPNYTNGFQLTLQPQMLSVPLRWKKPRLIFVNSMSDLFHQRVPQWFIADVFDVMARANWHTFQVLTKRAERLLSCDSMIHWLPNIWMGVSVESKDHYRRIDALRKSGAQTKFLSLEPLLGPMVDINVEGIDWVIVGGESGPQARPMDPEWVLEIRDICQREGVPFFFKQWGGKNKKQTGRFLEGRLWSEMPQINCDTLAQANDLR